ncbi:glycosyltransferase family 39 protein [bacterium]|nr:glycosyltransferase family 39 protein [candidate division CSSED10-310 bacterium]
MLTLNVIGRPDIMTTMIPNYVKRLKGINRSFLLKAGTGLLLFSIGYSSAICLVYGNLDSKLPFSVYYYGDAEVFLAYGAAVAEGLPFDMNLPFRPPVTAWFLALIYFVTHGYKSILLIKHLLAISGGAIAWLTYEIACMVSNRTIAFLAGAMCSLSFGLSVIATVPGTESIYLMLLLLTVFLLCRKCFPRWIDSFIIGVVTAFACLTRGEHILLIPLLFYYINQDALKIWITQKTSKQLMIAFKRSTIFIFGLSIVLLPWMIRNAFVISKINDAVAFSNESKLEPLPMIVPVTLYGPLNFALANLPPSDGGFSRDALPMVNDSQDIDPYSPEHRKFLIHGYSLGFKELNKSLKYSVSLFLKKLKISSDAFALGFCNGNYPSGLNGKRRSSDMFAPDNKWFKWVVILFGCLGWNLFRKQHSFFAYVCLWVFIHRIITIVLFFGYVRQGILIMPFMFLLCARSFYWLFEKRNNMSLPALFCGAGLLAGLVTNIYLAQFERRFEVDYKVIKGTQIIDHQQEVVFRDKGLVSR